MMVFLCNLNENRAAGTRRMKGHENYYTHVERRKDPLSIDATLGEKKFLKVTVTRRLWQTLMLNHAQPSLHKIQSILPT